MTEQDTDFLEIGFGQLGQYFQLDGVVAKRLCVPLQRETAQPAPNVHRVVPALVFGA
jgi:hypothetical protein